MTSITITFDENDPVAKNVATAVQPALDTRAAFVSSIPTVQALAVAQQQAYNAWTKAKGLLGTGTTAEQTAQQNMDEAVARFALIAAQNKYNVAVANQALLHNQRDIAYGALNTSVPELLTNPGALENVTSQGTGAGL